MSAGALHPELGTATILAQPDVWRLLNHVHHQHPGTAALAVLIWCETDYLTLTALTRGEPPILHLVDRWDPHRPAPAVNGPDQLQRVGLRLTTAGAEWLAANPENLLLRRLAEHGRAAHLSTLLGQAPADAPLLAHLTALGLITVRHLAQQRPLHPDEITDGLLGDCRAVTVTLTDRGALIPASRP